MRRIALVVLALAGVLGCREADSAPADDVAREKVYLDVRTPAEFAAGHVEGAINIPVETIDSRWVELEPHRADSVIVYCRSGRRSAAAIQVLRQQGFEFLRNGGGLDDMRNGR